MESVNEYGEKITEKELKEFAEEIVDYLLAETPIELFRKNLEKIEKT